MLKFLPLLLPVLLVACSSDPELPFRLNKSDPSLAVPPSLLPTASSGQGVAPEPNFVVQRSVYFAPESSQISAKESLVLAANVRYLNQHPETAVTIEAFADELDTAEKNQKLAQERGEQVYRELLNSGLLATKILSVTGKSLSLLPGERPHPGNRRADLIYSPVKP